MPAPVPVRRCHTIGPITDSTEADGNVAILNPQAAPLRLRQEYRSSVDSYVLLAPPQQSMAHSRALTEKKQAAGVTDYYIFPEGPHQHRIFAGHLLQQGVRIGKAG